MKGKKPVTALYRAPTFSLLLVSHDGISSCRDRQVEKGSGRKDLSNLCVSPSFPE